MTNQKHSNKISFGPVKKSDLETHWDNQTSSYEPYGKNLFMLHKVPKFKRRFAR